MSDQNTEHVLCKKVSFAGVTLRLAAVLIIGVLAAGLLTAGLLNIGGAEKEDKVVIGTYKVSFPEDEASLQAMADQLKYEMEKNEVLAVEPASGEADPFGTPVKGNTNSLFSFFTPVSQ